MAHIHLLGTLPYEIDGRERLTRALAIERPDMLTVEASPEWIEKTKDLGWHEWREHLLSGLATKSGISWNRESLTWLSHYLKKDAHYEINVCQEHGQKNNIPLHLIDHPSAVNLLHVNRMGMIDALIKNIVVGLEGEIHLDAVRYATIAEYGLAEALISGRASPSTGEKYLLTPYANFLGHRDSHMAMKIEELAYTNLGKIVHVGSFLHLLDGPCVNSA